MLKLPEGYGGFLDFVFIKEEMLYSEESADSITIVSFFRHSGPCG